MSPPSGRELLTTLRPWTLVLAGVAAVLLLARCNGERAGAREAEAAQQRAQIQLLRAGLRRHFDSVQVLTRAARTTDAPHEAAVRASLAADAAAARQAARARAAAADAQLTLERARAELAAAADTLEALRRQTRLERAAAATRLASYQVVVTYVAQTPARVDALADAQAARIRSLERGTPWYRKVLGAACALTTTSGGAGLGATLGGPAGAIGGAAVGWATGALACR